MSENSEGVFDLGEGGRIGRIEVEEKSSDELQGIIRESANQYKRGLRSGVMFSLDLSTVLTVGDSGGLNSPCRKEEETRRGGKKRARASLIELILDPFPLHA